jgi:hypothetical protein
MGEQPQTRHASREQERRRDNAILPIEVILAVLVLGAAIYLGGALFRIGSPPASPSSVGPPTNAVAPSTIPNLVQLMNGALTATPSPDPSTTTEPTHKSTGVSNVPAALVTAVSSCQERWQLQSVALAAADRSLSQWRRHLDIMNDLQDGRISLATAKAQWPYTTYKAGENVTAFRSADAALAGSPATCAVPDSTSGQVADALGTCAASMRTVDAALVKARVAIAPWERHLKDQTHFAMGMMTPAAAEAAWRVMWKTGLATLPPYEAVADGARAAICPLAD